MPLPCAYKEHKKVPFLRALARIGSTIHAARSVRISRWAVADWRRVDRHFNAAFVEAKRAYQTFKASGFILTDARLTSRGASGFLPSHSTPAGEAIAGGAGRSPHLFSVT